MPQLDLIESGLAQCISRPANMSPCMLVMTQLLEECSAHPVLSQQCSNDGKLGSMPNKSSRSSGNHHFRVSSLD